MKRRGRKGSIGFREVCAPFDRKIGCPSKVHSAKGIFALVEGLSLLPLTGRAVHLAPHFEKTFESPLRCQELTHSYPNHLHISLDLSIPLMRGVSHSVSNELRQSQSGKKEEEQDEEEGPERHQTDPK